MFILLLFAGVKTTTGQNLQTKTLDFRPRLDHYFPSESLADTSIVCAFGIFMPSASGSMILKYKPDGTKIWSKLITNPVASYLPYKIPVVNAIAVNPNRIILCGEVFNYNNTEGFAAGMDTSGNLLWSFQYGDTVPSTWGNMMYERSWDVVSQGNYFIMSCVARPYSISGNPYAYNCLVSFDTAGVIQWTKVVPILANEHNRNAIEITAGGLYFLFCDYTRSFLMKTDLYGNAIWTKTLPQKYSVLDIDPQGDVVVASEIVDTNNVFNIYVSKFNASGILKWAYRYEDNLNGNLHQSWLSDIICLSDTTIMIGIPSSADSSRAHMLHLDKNGGVKKFLTHPTDFGSQCNSILEYSKGNLFIGGTDDYDLQTNMLNAQVIFADTSLGALACQFYPDTLSAVLLNYADTAITLFNSSAFFYKTATSHGVHNPVIQETLSCLTGTPELATGEDFPVTIFPNPASGQVVVNLRELPHFEKGRIDFYDLAGRVALSFPLVTGENVITFSGQLSNGLYQCVVEIDRKIVKRDKLVIIR